MLPTVPYEQLNILEPNGSTPLHAAAYIGHMVIVHLLSHQSGCYGQKRNRHGYDGYEEAKPNDIRHMFHRPSVRNRFFDDDGNNDIQQLIVMD
ncbi:unnamed protein product [Didymodactylos carnosus]|uniref:Uncharacterized protein n=1 Tax=Didymodactylos carnosus TaxID=1234261 RepID=A0A815I2C7_9BILA|nr:unnamed protein product [Didymodactylos carnosus]CAF1358167.1 unnamed protein product [Didymodactylos carnosus]CAF3853704.1 unnamed protein product [Didymodactylos carnosus]CAF4233976.1 unnamed protein product [Didymodactylos carnosus]